MSGLWGRGVGGLGHRRAGQPVHVSMALDGGGAGQGASGSAVTARTGAGARVGICTSLRTRRGRGSIGGLWDVVCLKELALRCRATHQRAKSTVSNPETQSSAWSLTLELLVMEGIGHCSPIDVDLECQR